MKARSRRGEARSRRDRAEVLGGGGEIAARHAARYEEIAARSGRGRASSCATLSEPHLKLLSSRITEAEPEVTTWAVEGGR